MPQRLCWAAFLTGHVVPPVFRGTQHVDTNLMEKGQKLFPSLRPQIFLHLSCRRLAMSVQLLFWGDFCVPSPMGSRQRGSAPPAGAEARLP